jgi:DNA ligase (NAD+)
MSRLNDLVMRIEQANADYYSGAAKISDAEYDALKDELKDCDSEHRLLNTVGFPASDVWQKRKHSIPMTSLGKVNTIEELSEWARRLKCFPSMNEFSLQEKLDGISVSLDYVDGKFISGTTRGDGLVGECITPNIIKMQGVPLILPTKFTGSVRGEIILFKKDWEEHFSEMANPRNAASGLSRRQTDDGQEHLRIMCYDIIGNVTAYTEEHKFEMLRTLGFQRPVQFLCPIEGVKDIYDYYQSSERDSLPYEIDGFVIKVNNLKEQLYLGRAGDRENANPRGQVALKFSHEMRESTVQKIDWQVGNTGRVTPVAYFTAVKIAGVNIKKASLHNTANLKQLKIAVGARVLVSRRNDVIPYIEEVLEPVSKEAEAPSHCPICGSILESDGEYLQCANDICSARVTGNIKKWITNLEIDDFGPKLIESLYAEGLVTTVADLYCLTVTQVADIDRMGERSARKVLKNLHDKIRIPLHIVLGSLNIQSCGRRVFERVVTAGFGSLDKVMAATPESLQKIKGIGEALSNDICEGLSNRRDLIDSLSKHIEFLPYKESDVGALSGKSFCFTGSMSTPRTKLQGMVSDAGGSVKSSISTNIDYLIIADPDSVSVKANKARALGIKLLGEDEFLSLLSNQ